MRIRLQSQPSETNVAPDIDAVTRPCPDRLPPELVRVYLAAARVGQSNPPRQEPR